MNVRMYLEIFLILFIKHCIIDFSQPLIPCPGKEVYCSKACIMHPLSVSAPQLVIIPIWALIRGIFDIWIVISCIISTIVEFSTHLHIDWAKTNFRLSNQYFWESRCKYVVMQCVDQSLHFVVLALCSWVLLTSTMIYGGSDSGLGDTEQ